MHPMRQNRTSVKTAASKSKSSPGNVPSVGISSCTGERRAKNDNGNPFPESGTVRVWPECDEENENLSQVRSDCEKRFIFLPQLRSLFDERNIV